ncbi:MAG: dynamin family protein [Anaerovibrio sp.]|uniref:dynamin family protein n=1 Tax=Anaerovibrio sp. TaxID=1872532 RepID=UPI0025CBE176|nr:dynamin family protein [Anaerovibrio sp.]MCR5176346.1 dynamin family protein [Anaerovibrio sp.]
MTRDLLENKLTAAYKFFEGKHNHRNVVRIGHLAEKLINKSYDIAFAGHFSAGKSRLINSFLDADILPSSPIPTSANLVKLCAGTDYARVYFSQGDIYKYLAPYDYELIKDYCRDGNKVSCVELSSSALKIPEGVEILDTPGIDSTDDAHRLATEDAIHLADVIFYVMDYNHVQSEHNFTFTRELTEAGKEVYLIINQIDKYTREELTWDEYKDKVQSSFDAWGVKYRGIFYISLKDPGMEYSQYDLLMELISEKIANRYEGLEESIYSSMKKIINEYIDEIDQQELEANKASREILEGIGPKRLQELKAEYGALIDEKTALNTDWESEFKAGIDKILDNAYLMPTSTRDLARDYLEACQPSFKIGLFGRGKKTMAELQRRKQLFYDDASEKAKAQIEWHLKTFCMEIVRKNHLENVKLQKSIQELSVKPPEQLLTDAMRSGAKLTQDGTYVIKYTENFAEGIKEVARNKAAEVKELIAPGLRGYREGRLKDINKRLDDLNIYQRAWSCVDKAIADNKAVQQEIDDILNADKPVISDINIPDITGNKERMEKIIAPADQKDNRGKIADTKIVESASEKVREHINVTAKADSSFEGKDLKGSERIKAAYLKLQRGAELIGQVPGLEKLADELAERADRLQNKGFMVTLFGAFSAGKSSFANSLLGENVMPVSPNPTTAAINMVLPVDFTHKHGTTEIRLKSSKLLLDDLIRAFKPFDLHPVSLDEAFEMAGKAIQLENNQYQREKTFLRAFINGYANMADRLGSVFESDLEDFRQYAVHEDKSCFVDCIKLYYDCPLTARGITLVDTPGADSINARHTNMSFNFIRTSDVVLYVTYYNHAFSRADREFIIQLGRVKDSFQMDKIFFIINAIDLADSVEEAASVESYVAKQLKTYGITTPQLFSLSSQKILVDKLAGRDVRIPFETRFFSFVDEELSSFAIQAALEEYNKAAAEIKQLIDISKTDRLEKEIKISGLVENKKDIRQMLDSTNDYELVTGLHQEIDELIYYVKQNVFLRFLDFYREAFNPAGFQRNKDSKKQLQDALEQLLESMGFDLSQQLRATGLRVDNYMSRKLFDLQGHINELINDINPELQLTAREYTHNNQLEFQPAFIKLDRSVFSKPLTVYKNPRDFFEGGKTKLLSDMLERLLSDFTDDYLKPEKQKLTEYETVVIKKLFSDVIRRFRQRIGEKIDADISALSGGYDITLLEKLYEQL